MKINKNLLSLIPLTAVAVTTITSVFAWYVSTIGITQDLSDGKLAANATYYESGTGTESDPFIISNARHLYNLAWLQDLGKYDDKVYYFELKNDIDMSQLKIGSNSASPIPAIGIDDHPFISSFNGNGHTINNLFVATSFSSSSYIKPSQEVLNNHNQNQDKKTYNTTSNTIISSYNGLFGVIKKFNDSKDSKSKVTNFTIANAKIESSQNTLVGYICGYVNSDLSNIGVASSNLTIGTGVTHITTTSTTYPISKYGIVGDYNNASGGIEWSQNSDGSGTDYGTSTDLRGLYEKVHSIDSSLADSEKLTIPKGYALPFDFDSTSKITEGKGSTSVTTSGKSEGVWTNVSISPPNASTIPVASTGTNIGYYSGGEIKIYEDYFSSDNVNFDNMKTAGNSQISVDSDTDHINKIKTYLKTSVSSEHRKGDTAMGLTGTYFKDGAKLTDFPYSADNYLVVKDAKVGSWNGDLFIPARGIWIAPTKPGRFEFVAINTKTGSGLLSNATIAIIRLKRSTAGNYSTGFSNTTYMQQNDFTNDMCGCIIYGGSNAYTPYYYGVDISQSDIDNGYEFFITKYSSDVNSSNLFIVYLDIGTTGSSSDTPTYIGTIKDIDYTYYTDSNKTSYALVNTSDGFTLSGVYFNIDGTTTKEVALYVMRSLESSHLVYYYFVSDGGLTNTVTGTATKKDSLDDWKNQE